MSVPGSEEWIAERRTGIGASDAAAAAGVSKWMTPLELYLDKKGELVRNESESMRWGTLLEPVVRQRYVEVTGRHVAVPDKTFRHPVDEFAIAHLDGVIDDAELFEAKTARSDDGWGPDGSDEVPLEYMLQCQHGMFVAQLPASELAVLIGGSDFRIYRIPADAELQASLLEKERSFWKMVVESVMPPATTPSDVKLKWKRSTDTKAFGGPTELDVANRLAMAKWFRKRSEEVEEQLETALKSTMQSASELVVDGITIATWKSARGSKRFDVGAFALAHPDLYEKFMRETDGSRRFLLKLKGEFESCLPMELRQPLPPLTISNSSPAEAGQ